MKIRGVVLFEDEEREALLKALSGSEYVPGLAGHLAKLRSRSEVERFDERSLNDLLGTMLVMIDMREPQTTAEWWREQCAPGSAHAPAEALAEERRREIERLREACEIVSDGLLAVRKIRCSSDWMALVTPGR